MDEQDDPRDFETIPMTRGMLQPLLELASKISETLYYAATGQAAIHTYPEAARQNMAEAALELGAIAMTLSGMVLNEGVPTVRWTLPLPLLEFMLKGMSEYLPGVAEQAIDEIDRRLTKGDLPPGTQDRVRRLRDEIAAAGEPTGETARRELARQELDEGSALEEALGILGINATD